MNVQLWHLIVGGVLTIAASVWAAKVTGKASVKVAEVTVESGAYGRAEAIYKGAISRLETENGQLRADLEVEKKAREELSQKHEALNRAFNEIVIELESLKRRLQHDGTDVSDVPD